MERSDNTCEHHGDLVTDIKWLKKVMYCGFGILLSAIVYFNNELHTNYIAISDSIGEVQELILVTSSGHDSTLARLDSRTENLEIHCCGEYQ